MSAVFSTEMNFHLSYFFNIYFYHLGIKNFWNCFKDYKQYRKNKKYDRLSNFLQCIEAVKRRVHMYGRPSHI